MSYMDEYNKLKKKRLEAGTKSSGKATNSGGSSYLNEYNKLRGQTTGASSFDSFIRQRTTLSQKDKGEDKKKEKEKESEAKKEERKWFQKGAFEDGYQFGDLTKTILGSKEDAETNIWSGILGIGEKIVDAGMTIGTAMNQGSMMQAAQSEMIYNTISGNKEAASTTLQRYQDAQDEAEKGTAEFVAKDLYDEKKVANKLITGKNYVTQQVIGYDAETDSIFGDKSDSLIQSGGQLLAQIGANTLVPGSGMALMATTAFGSEAENAFKNDATFDEAMLSATISAGAEVLTERLGGISFGGKTLTDKMFEPLARKMTSKLAKALVYTGKIAADATMEGFEEVVTGYASAIGQQMTYMENKEIEELFSDEDRLEAFIGGFVLGGAGSAVEIAQAKSKGIDPISGLTKNEQAVANKVYEDELAKKEESGKVSSKEKTKLYNKILNDMEKGRIDTDTIESVLGGETYEGYKSLLDKEIDLKKKAESLTNEINTILDKESPTIRDSERLAEARKELEQVKSNLGSLDLKTAKSNLFSEVDKLTANDTKLRESYNEKARRGQAFEADLTQYDAKQQETIKKAVESGILNNTNRTHEFVDLVAKVSADKGVPFDFANNQKLKESGFAIDGKQVNGFVTKDGITVNVNSAKSLDTVVGHEITHVLEGTDLYTELQTAIVEYAKSKNDYQGRYDTLTKLYENIEGANIDSELTAELVGDYLFTDTDFINNLSTNHRNVFEKIYDEIKYLYKVATAGSKEARELERVKKAFEDAYRNGGQAQTEGTKYSIGKIVDENNKSYGVGVHLDSTLLDDLSPAERLGMVKEYVKELGGESFTAYDNNGNAVDITIAKSNARFKNQSGKKTPVNKDLTTKRIGNEVKQEAIALVDELIVTADYDGSKASRYSHGWLDNNGQNDWDYWTTYIQDKNNTIWEATLNIANTADGEKILYDISPIKKVGQSVKSDTIPTDNKVPQKTGNVKPQYSLSEETDTKQKQLEIINATNPAYSDSFTWIRKVEDIHTLEETLSLSDWADYDEFDPDLTRADILKAIDSGKITVYSSHPIENGAFVTPSLMEAQTYAGDGKVYQKTVDINNVAWIDPTQGQYAEVGGEYSAAKDSSGNNADIFYSQMAKVVDDVKQEKLGAASVVNMLRGKGVKAEEIKWSGIESFLEGKKSVTKAELQEFINGSMLQIEETVRDGKVKVNPELKKVSNKEIELYVNGKPVGTYVKDGWFGDGWTSTGKPQLYFSNKTEILEWAENKYRNSPKWKQYKLDGGENYREILFKMPGADYSNPAMQAHWGRDTKGVLAHARVQDIEANGSKMLFVEEIQSDWHNEGHKQGYAENRDATEDSSNVPDAPFSDNYHEFVLKRLLREGAEKGYDSIGWTTADIQSKRWSEDYAESYRIEYDQNIPKFLKKYGKQWGAEVGKTTLEDGTTVWSMDITPAMKNSVLNEGQPLYSLSEKDVAPTGKFLGKDIALETAPVAETTEAVEPDVAPIAEAKVEDYSPGESLEEQLAKADDSIEILDSETEALFSDYYAQNISDAEFQEKWKDLDKRFTQARQEQERLSAEMTDINNRKYESLDDSDIPPEAEAPYPGESNSIAPVDPFAERNMHDVGNRKVKAYMHENPEVKPFFRDAAMGMLYDLHNGTKGERIFNEQVHYESGYEKGWMGTKRHTTEDIAELLDQWHYTYSQIEAGLNAIIEDNGKENNAVSKRIEFMLDKRLRNGYKDVFGEPMPKDEAYINLLKEKGIDDYRREAFDGFMDVADQYAPPVEGVDTAEDVAPVDDIAPLKVEPAIEGEQDVLDEFEQTEQEKAPEKTTRAKLHSQIVDRIKSVFTGRGIDFDKVLDDAHRMNALSINDNTPQRVNDKTFGYEAGEVLNELTFNKVALNESEGIKWLNKQVDTIRNLSKKYKIKPLSKESAAAQMYAEGFWVNKNDEIIAYGDAELAQDFPDVQVRNRIKALAKDPTIRKIYDDTLSAINESRARNAYPEIPRLDNYYLHFRAMDDTFSRLGVPFNPNDIKAKDLPTDINGTTIDRKPGQPFFTSSFHREGKRTSFDMLGGVERYLNSAKNQIYHIDDIQTARALWGYIADRYGQAHGLENLDYMEYEAQAEHIQKVYDGHLSNYARFLTEYANNLAGKTALIDRGVEGLIGRRALQFINTVNTQTSRNQIGYSISSPLTNFIPSMEAIARTSKRDSIKAFAQTVSNVFRKDGFVESDPTLIRRKGADRFSKTLWEKMSDPGYILMGAVDSVTSEFIVRTKYNELTRKGMDSKRAHIKAGEWASRVMGDRSLGQMPLLYNSKFMGLFTKYQLEVRNQLDSAFYDNIQEINASTKDIENQTARNAKTAAKIASKTLQIAVLNHVFGMAFEKIAGYNPAFDIISTIATLFGWDDDEEDEDTFGDNANQAFKELLGDLPYTSLITDGGRIPAGSALPIKQLVTGIDKYGNEKSRLETVAEALPYYLLPGGYGQIKKTASGLGMFSEEHPVSGSYTDSGNLRFPVEKTFGNVLQAGLFGQYASENARDYFDNERSPLKEKQIQEYIDVDIPIKDYWEYREGLKGKDTLGEKLAYIDTLDLPISKKNILANNQANRDEPIDMAEFGEYGSLEEFDYAVKYPEKYQFLEANGITVEEYNNFDDDTKEAYSWAYQNPDKYAVSKAISNDVVEYKSYTKAISKIEADKDENGKSINGSKKEKVFAYVDSLPLDYGQKSILFKSQYKADDSMNMDIIEYLDSREDIGYEEMVTILTELGFTVNGNNVYWD